MKTLLNILLVVSALSAVIPANAMESSRAKRAAARKARQVNPKTVKPKRKKNAPVPAQPEVIVNQQDPQAVPAQAAAIVIQDDEQQVQNQQMAAQIQQQKSKRQRFMETVRKYRNRALIAASSALATGVVYANTTIINCASIAHDPSAVGYAACMGI